MENTTVVTENVQPADVGSGLTAEQLQEEQVARERYQKSINPDTDNPNDVPEGYNPDGTPIEEEVVNWETKYKELEIQHQLATNPNLYQTESGVYDATDIINDFKATGVLSDEHRQELLSTGLTNEQIDEAIVKFGGEVKKPSDTKPKDDTQQQEGTFNVKKYETEYATTGKLSEESYNELAKLGFSKRDVDIYINGQQEIARNFAKTIFDKVGGEQAYTELIQWSADNLDKATIERYNEAISSNDRDTIISLIEYAKFKKDGTTANSKPNRISGDSSSVPAFAPFKDKTEWQRAMANKNYGKDIKYTNMVDNRYLVARRQGLI